MKKLCTRNPTLYYIFFALYEQKRHFQTNYYNPSKLTHFLTTLYGYVPIQARQRENIESHED